MSFAWPWLFLVLPLPWLLRLLLAPAVRGPALRVVRLPDVVPAAPHASPQLWVAALAWLLLVTAAARPQMPDGTAPPASGRALMLAFDVSMSMATADLKHGSDTVARLQAARLLADSFLERERGDRVGLVVFGAQAYLHTPLTYDVQAVRAALGGMQAGLAGRETALGDAIALSVKYLRTLPEHARTLVLLTDGANTAGNLAPLRAAWLAQRESVRIHVVGIGASAELDEAALKSTAEQTGGSYARAADGAAIAAFFDRLDRIEPAVQASTRRPMRELYVWPLALACLLAAGLSVPRWRRVAA